MYTSSFTRIHQYLNPEIKMNHVWSIFMCKSYFFKSLMLGFYNVDIINFIYLFMYFLIQSCEHNEYEAQTFIQFIFQNQTFFVISLFIYLYLFI